MKNGIIRLGSPDADELLFLPENFSADSYLWKMGDAIMLSFIASSHPGHGALRRLVKRIHALGLDVKVPTPLGRMQDIVLRNGYEHTTEPHDQDPGELVEVWVWRARR